MIEVKGFSKTYDKFLAVDNISFDIPAGSVAALVGPNGAGKTTTIRTLCGILRPTQGRLVINGHDVSLDAVAVKRCTAYVPDDPPLFENLTVYEHLHFTAQAYRLSQWEASADYWLGEFELMEKRNALAGSLSRGMRQKVALACAYIRNASVLLLDEPMTGLDPQSIRRLKRSIIEQAKAGATFLVSSHLLSLVEEICDHLVIMQKGRVKFCDTIRAARSLLGQDQNLSLEDIFFQLTEPSESQAVHSEFDVNMRVARGDGNSD